MAKVRITKEFSFEMAHILRGHEGPCKNIHGHSYKLSVTISGEPITDSNSPQYGMLMDFSDIKKLVRGEVVDVFDHALVVSRLSLDDYPSLKDITHKLLVVDYQPTSENLLEDIASRIKDKLLTNCRLHSLKLRETATAYSEWFAADN